MSTFQFLGRSFRTFWVVFLSFYFWRHEHSDMPQWLLGFTIIGPAILIIDAIWRAPS